MKAGWQTKKLGDLLEVQNGYAFSSKDYSKSGFFLIRIGNVQNGYVSLSDPKFVEIPPTSSLQRFVLSEGDILVSLTGNVGRVGVIQEGHLPAVLNQRVARIKINKDSLATKDFLLFFLYSDWFRDELMGAGHGAAQQNVSTKDIVEIQLPVPPLPEQHRIVGILDAAFDGIATAKANAEKNLQNARALFESHLQSVFTERGEGWVEKSLGECFRLKSGDGLTSKAMNAGAYPVFGGNGIAGMHNEFNLSGDNVIIGRVGALCGNARHIAENIWLTDNAFKIVDFNCEFDGAFLTYLLNYKNLRSLARQAAQPVISNSSLKDLLLNFPGLLEQQRITKQLDALSKEIQHLESLYQRKLTALDDLKKSLLHQAFSGAL